MIASYVTKVAELERQVVGLKEGNENLGKEDADLVPINRELQLENKLLADGTETRKYRANPIKRSFTSNKDRSHEGNPSEFCGTFRLSWDM
jgi:regulator of replication initiation timing